MLGDGTGPKIRWVTLYDKDMNPVGQAELDVEMEEQRQTPGERQKQLNYLIGFSHMRAIMWLFLQLECGKPVTLGVSSSAPGKAAVPEKLISLQLIPLQYWLFTPGLQWQCRGKIAYLTGVWTGNAGVQGFAAAA